MDRKDDVRYLLPESRWQPIWIGMPQAQEDLWGEKDLIVVEGRFDVFAILQLLAATGNDKAVLGSGPAHLSWKQTEYLRRWCQLDEDKRPPKVYIAYDNDDPGKKGTADALKHLDQRGVQCRELRYGKPQDDPGEIWDRGGVEALRKAFPYM